MTLWYDPDELKAEADGLKRQPAAILEDTNPEGYDYDEVEGEISEKLQKGIDRINEIEQIVDTEIRPNQ